MFNLIEWINGVTRLNKSTMDEFQNNISNEFNTLNNSFNTLPIIKSGTKVIEMQSGQTEQILFNESELKNLFGLETIAGFERISGSISQQTGSAYPSNFWNLKIEDDTKLLKAKTSNTFSTTALVRLNYVLFYKKN